MVLIISYSLNYPIPYSSFTLSMLNLLLKNSYGIIFLSKFLSFFLSSLINEFCYVFFIKVIVLFNEIRDEWIFEISIIVTFTNNKVFLFKDPFSHFIVVLLWYENKVKKKVLRLFLSCFPIGYIKIHYSFPIFILKILIWQNSKINSIHSWRFPL